MCDWIWEVFIAGCLLDLAANIISCYLQMVMDVFESLHSGTNPGLLEIEERHQQGYCWEQATVWQAPYATLASQSQSIL